MPLKNRIFRFLREYVPVRDRGGNLSGKGFTLVEVMAAACVLSLGIVMVSTSLFGSLDAARHARDIKVLGPWLDEKLWLAEDEVMKSGPYTSTGSGEIFINGRQFKWSVSVTPAGGIEGLYQIDANIYRREGKRRLSVSRSMYVSYEEPQEM